IARGRRQGQRQTVAVGDATRELVQQVLQSEWRAVGVHVRIANQPARALFGESLPQREFRHMAMYALIAAPSNVPRQMLHSEQIPSEANSFSGQNFPGYANPDVDRIIERLEISFDVIERQDLWAELQAIYARDLPALPLYFRSDMHVLPQWLQGYEPTGHQAPATLWVEDWFIAE
ncbi:MAG: peptide ABC transporter substrate-binding protein, partial [Pseudomonadota bacterium]